jgi:CheY-like chemotaxis protein
MSKRGPIIIVEDDSDDFHIFTEAFNSLDVRNELIFFRNGKEVYEYLLKATKQPFLILCDINMPEIDGIELREKIMASEALKKKSIPFVYYTTNSSTEAVNKAYSMSVQGYFVKSNSFEDLCSELKLIYDYWQACRHPNSMQIEL